MRLARGRARARLKTGGFETRSREQGAARRGARAQRGGVLLGEGRPINRSMWQQQSGVWWAGESEGGQEGLLCLRAAIGAAVGAAPDSRGASLSLEHARAPASLLHLTPTLEPNDLNPLARTRSGTPCLQAITTQTKRKQNRSECRHLALSLPRPPPSLNPCAAAPHDSQITGARAVAACSLGAGGRGG